MFFQVFSALSMWTLPTLVFAILAFGAYRKVNIYEAFIEGAKDGLLIVWRITPYLLTMLVAIRVFQDSQAMRALIDFISPIAKAVGIPGEILPLAIVRPLSGSGSLGVLANILQTYGPDSRIGLIASTLQGSTETVFYVITVYLGAVQITRARHIPIVGILADVTGLIASVLVVNWLLS